VSCIYGLGSPEEYEKVNIGIKKGAPLSRGELIRSLVRIHFERTNSDLSPGKFRVLGNNIEVMPIAEKTILRIEIFGDIVQNIAQIDAVSRSIINESMSSVFIFPAKHFITPEEDRKIALKTIKLELEERLKALKKEGKILEAERLKRRTNYDLALIREVGYCNGIENYSRHFSGKAPGEPPDTLLSYFPKDENGHPDFLTIIDESHVTVPQLRGMQAGDRSRKDTLIEHGFRLPSARDNRPLSFDEFLNRTGSIVFTSATPGEFEMKNSTVIAEQIIRPTGLLDPELVVRPVVARDKYNGQIVDFVKEAKKAIEKGGRVLATTLTKRMAEDLSELLKEKGIKTEYLHSDVDTLDRVKRISDFRKGKFDCLVGVNLLREGLDLPEVILIGIFDADREGFLRSETSLIQIIGRAARNVDGKVILYADTLTSSLKKAIDETNRRRFLQLEYNKKHNIVPKSIQKHIKDIVDEIEKERENTIQNLIKLDEYAYNGNFKKIIKEKTKQMNEAVKNLDFETAAILRDEIFLLQNKGNLSKHRKA
jgi:excinuclease ABC subunit B